MADVGGYARLSLCGGLSAAVDDPAETGYGLLVACSGGAVFERCVTPEMADHDLLRSRLPAFRNESTMTARGRPMLAALGFLWLEVLSRPASRSRASADRAGGLVAMLCDDERGAT